MTPVQAALAEGRLADALDLQGEIVRAEPDDSAACLFLFELQTAAGRWQEARDQLKAISNTDPGWPPARKRFRQLLRAAYWRDRGRLGGVIGPINRHCRHRRRVCAAQREGRIDDAIRHVDRADSLSPIISGFIDGREFEGLRDVDDRYGSVLEVLAGESYSWVPFEEIRKLTLLPVAGLLDTIYRPARLRTMSGADLSVMVPLVYPRSQDEGGEFALGMATDWPDVGGMVCGIGGREWLIGEEEGLLGDYQQLEIRGVCDI